ncbi:MAG: peptidylprolyl isomerase [Oscillospiraceae bacterium]|nr:peptidylprolyl isomerase [Oscillospiraceae bacterium]
MENGTQIVLELYPDKAPNTVNNFISLIQQGFYNGLKFHRVSDGFMIQGGDPQGTGAGGPGYSIAGEFAANGFDVNDISHTAGVLSMARTGDPDSAGSQFFICDGDASFLDGQYAAFGCVTSGIEEVHRIADMVLEPNGGPPPTDQVMKSVTVDTRGREYPAPDTIPE